MPRVTRAALRTNVILEDEADIAAATPLPSTPTTARMPLSEVVANVNGDGLIAGELEIELKPAKKGTIKGKKGKASKKGGKRKDADKENGVEVLEDDNQSSASSAVEEACEDLLKEKSGERFKLCVRDGRPRTPPSKAVHLAVRRLSPKAQTPRFDPKVHKLPEPESKPDQEGDDSFVGSIETRTPAKMVLGEPLGKNLVGMDAAGTLDVAKDDSFAEHIVARSPVKSTLRIEDSVEAIDALEDAIEKIGESLPVIVDEPQSPVKRSPATTLAAKAIKKRPVTQKASNTKKTPPVPAKVKGPIATKKPTPSTEKPARIKRSPLEASVITTPRRAIAARSPSAKATPGAGTKATPRSNGPRVGTTPTITSVKAPTRTATNPPGGKRLRVSSITNPPFVPQRSTKAPTRSTFTLPGEAIAQKLKAQREERMKREEEEQVKKREFKARPVPIGPAPVVKATATSKARMSLVKGDATVLSAASTSGNGSKYGSVRIAKTRAHPRISSTSSTLTNINGPIKKATSDSIEQPNVKANISAPRAPSLGGPSHGAVTPKALAVQRSRGKEVFGRERAGKEAKDKERREKEEAAKKARAEAAERGRIASREWAEKMKAKKVSAENGAGNALAVVS